MKHVKYLSILFAFIICCTHKKPTTEPNTNEDTIVSQIDSANFNYTIYPFVFDSLPNDKKKAYLNTFKDKLSPIVLRYYGRYKEMKDIDTLFEILTSNSLDSSNYKEIIPLDTYIFREASENIYADGYVGEYIWDKYYKLFMEHSGYFYQYLNYLKHENRLKECGDILYVTFSTSINMYNLSHEELNSILKEHIYHLVAYAPIIRLGQDFVNKNYEHIKTEDLHAISFDF